MTLLTMHFFILDIGNIRLREASYIERRLFHFNLMGQLAHPLQRV